MSLVSNKVEEFFSKYRLKKLSKGQILVMAGEEPEGIIYLIKGEIGQYDITAQGQNNIVNVFKPSSFFPMSWAINNTPNEYFYEAITDIEYRVGPAKDVVSFVKTNPEVMFDLLSRVYKGTDGLLKRTALLMSSKASTRLIFEIVITCRRSKNLKDDGSCVLNISESDLASRTGLSRETVNREIQKLKSSNSVQVNKSVIKVMNVNQLESYIQD